MSRPVVLVSAFAAALAAHAAVFYALACLSARCARLPVPVFQEGVSSVDLTFVAASAPPEEHEPPAEPPPPDPPVEPAVEKEKALEQALPFLAAPDSDATLPVMESAPERESPAPPASEVSPFPAPAVPLPSADADPVAKGVQAELVPESAMRPHYPLGARLRGEEGTVTLRVEVDRTGAPVEVSVEQSSGFAALDRAALRAARLARYVDPSGAPPRRAAIVLTFRFRLQDADE